MAILPAVSSTSRVPEVGADPGQHRSFLADVVVEHGPRELLGRLFLKADTALRQRGIRLSFSDCDELKAVNARNSDSWSPILPIFDPVVSDVSDRNCIALVGRDANGETVYAHASRFYELGQGTLKDEIESLKIFYSDPLASALPGEAMMCSAPIASVMSGGVVFGGALWLHPRYRKGDIRNFTGPVMRSLSFTRWAPRYIFSFMVPKLIEAGVAQEARLHVDQEVTMVNTPVKRGGTINAGLVWIPHDEQLALLADYDRNLSVRDPEIDRGIVERTA